MDPNINRLLEAEYGTRLELEEAKCAHDVAKTELEAAQSRCPHKYGRPERKSHTTPGYHLVGDPPGTMGSDWRGPMDVPAQTKVWYERECLNCGKLQTTESRRRGTGLP